MEGNHDCRSSANKDEWKYLFECLNLNMTIGVNDTQARSLMLLPLLQTEWPMPEVRPCLPGRHRDPRFLT